MSLERTQRTYYGVVIVIVFSPGGDTHDDSVKGIFEDLINVGVDEDFGGVAGRAFEIDDRGPVGN